MKIFCISLKASVDRRSSFKLQMDKYGMDFEFFDAVDGRSSNNEILKKYNKQRWVLSRGRYARAGELGCFASHFLLWKKSCELRESIVVFEDDAIITSSFKKNIAKINENIERYPLIALLHAKGKKVEVFQCDDFSIDKCHEEHYGGVAYIVSPSAAEKLVRHADEWIAPVDCYMDEAYKHGVDKYMVYPGVVEHEFDFDTMIQNDFQEKGPLISKLTRTIYKLYKRFRRFRLNIKSCVGAEVNKIYR